jgi:hypothetical protein
LSVSYKDWEGQRDQVSAGFYFDLNPDCSAVGDINVRVTKQPEHGTVETVAATDYVQFPKVKYPL